MTSDAIVAIEPGGGTTPVETIGMRPGSRAALALLSVMALVAGACSSTPPAASNAPSVAAPSAAGSPAESASAGAGTKHVAILNKDMTDDEIKAEIAKEGTVNVGNWTYAATKEIVNQFQMYVKDTFGADIKLNYAGTQQPSTYLTALLTDSQSGGKASFDVIAVEENYWYDATQQGLVEENGLDSDLIPNASMVLDVFKHDKQSIAFQSTAYPGVVYDKTDAGYLKKLQDLADPRLKGKLTFPKPTDITAGGLLLGIASEMGKDYKDPEQMKAVVDWTFDNIGPNVAQWTTDQATPQKLFETGAVDAVGFWNSLARLEYLGSHKEAALLVPPTIYPANGYLWIPKNAQHPVLAQVFINWRLSKEVQFPNAWPIDHGAWSELSEGFLGPDYVDQVPDWFKADYFTYFPNLDQIQSAFKTIDWKAYNDSSKVFLDYFSQKLGQ
jgi:ABC-type Fe3+ transport system substrate-binding protein